MHWLVSSSDKEAVTGAKARLGDLRDDICNGTFWYDRIKLIREFPNERLNLAMENFPLPAAFNEASIALRAMIREKKKSNDDIVEEIKLLYWIAAIQSLGVPYSKRLKEPGFNILESIPGSVIKGLPVAYQKLGYQHLELLNKTDVKWIVSAWGEPKKHSTMNRIHSMLWKEYEDKLIDKRKQKIVDLFKM